MRLGTTLGLAALAAAACMAGAQAQTPMYVYNFNDATTSTSATETAANTAAFFSVDRSIRGPLSGSTLSTSFTPTDISATGSSNVVGFGGTAIGADGGDVAGVALALQGGGATGAIVNNGQYLQATANLTGFQNINVSFAIQKTGTGFNSDQFQYSLDGITFTNFGAAFTPASSFAAATDPSGVSAVQSFSLSSMVPGLNGDANAAFRIVFNGATSAAGNNRLDNLVISGQATSAPVPEASTTASFGLLLVLGLGGIAVARRRKQA